MASDLDQAATAIALAITIRCRRIAQFCSQVACVVFAQVLVAAQFPDVLQLSRLVTDLRQKTVRFQTSHQRKSIQWKPKQFS